MAGQLPHFFVEPHTETVFVVMARQRSEASEEEEETCSERGTHPPTSISTLITSHLIYEKIGNIFALWYGKKVG